MKDYSGNFIPVIKRTRGYRLYTENGERILDFYQDGGRSVLGNTPSGFSLSLKKEISKGCFSAFPYRAGTRAVKSLQMLAGVNITWTGIFQSQHEAVSYISSVEQKNYSFSDPLMEKREVEDSDDKIYLWYPFGEANLCDCLSNHRYIIPVLPFPGSFSPCAVISAGAGNKKKMENSVIDASGVQLAGIVRCISLLIKYMTTDPYRIWEKEREKIGRLWKTTGPYLVPLYSVENHDKIFKAFLKNRILISLSYNKPGALPGEISDGEMAGFLKTVEKVSEEYC